jgi:hypothetical protein
MWSSRRNREGKAWTIGLGGLLAGGLALAAGGCAPDYVTGSTAPVLFIIAALNDGQVLDSDIQTSSGTICPDFAAVDLAVRAKNPNTVTITVPQHVLVQQYDVRYFRSDGRASPGLDVPYAISGPMSAEVDVAAGGTTPVSIEVVRRQAKLEPPLSSITGFQIVSMIAEVTISGQTVAGQAVSASGRMQINFADYGDADTSCPSQN